MFETVSPDVYIRRNRLIFEVAALDAIKGWRFRPLVVDGEVREAVHELTVFFRLK